MKNESPYLADSNRLADVIAAIQATATYKFYKLPFAGWADRIAGDDSQEHHWRNVFQQHPEFFRLDSARQKASLVWRRQHPKRFDVDTGIKITKDAFMALGDAAKDRISRTPLSSSEIATLIETATHLHARALEQRQDKRWWIAALVSVLGIAMGFLGAVLGAYLGK